MLRQDPPQHRGTVARVLLWVAAYVVLDYVGVRTVFPDYGIALFFPAAGIAVAWMLATPARRGGWVVVGVLVLTTGVALSAGVAPPRAALLFGAAHALQVWIVGLVLRHIHGTSLLDGTAGHEMRTPAAFLALGVAAVVATLASAPVAMVAAAALTGQWDWLTPVSWSVRNTSSILVVASAVIVLRQHLRDGPRGLLPDGSGAVGSRSRLELGLLVALATIGGVLVLTSSLGLPSVFVVVVSIAWGSYRLGPPVAALACLALSALVLVAATRGAGPFAEIQDPWLLVGFVQAFCGICATLAMLLALGGAEQQRLTSALAHAARQAEDRLQLFESLSASTTDAVTVVDSDDRVVWANAAAGDYLPSPDSVEGWQLTDVDGLPLTPDRLPHRRALAGGTVTHERVVCPPVATSGERVVLSVSANALGGFENHPTATAVVVLRDVTADEDHRAQLQQFAGVVAHDLRGPLSSMSGWTETAIDALDELRRRSGPLAASDLALVYDALARVALRAGHMSELIEDLLRHAQAQDGTLQVADIATEELVREVADHHGARASLEIAGPLPPLRGDRGLLGQVVGNLISNGLKYVAPGTAPRIVVSGAEDSASSRLLVSDSGVGIPADQLPLIWAPFHRAHADYPGTGLGLAICRAIVERHGGRIEARPRAAGGTTFEVTLPR